MARNMKCRRVCAEPANRIFTPQQSTAQTVCINVDELEALRLCDLEGLEQDAAASRMNISRGTFQRILYAARRKSAEALCMGACIRIGGGNYEVCTFACPQGLCKRCRQNQSESGDGNHE
ncbi:DUF134 domain-containing protein [Candidatus Soleaferrea massiliensis]|uniref:DUF134 domain-containing protein n=1 Tax=Candidatus Soleaferrea massiliensis TaxID=1470354 RepID=UPI00058E9D63|nr:DUF134 domain-containing protein [Candidatus Soleaferrea massiliensis]